MRSIIRTRAHFDEMYSDSCRQLLNSTPFDRGEVHAQKITEPEMVTREIQHSSLAIEVDQFMSAWQQTVTPNLPWAEDHFQERVSGQPLNPPPSEAYWPFAQHGNSDHKQEGKFSHTYPERFWPRFANEGNTMKHSERVAAVPHVGLRFHYGDLNDLINVLRRNPRSRQAYLPVWFPEDLNAANWGERVPCTLGYHFLGVPDGTLDMTYYMRSCDIVRFFRDDVYMAGRLLQWVCDLVNMPFKPGVLRMHISSLHCFVGDDNFLKSQLIEKKDIRSSYNFEALG